ncbi:MAG: hypothetical protein ABEI74_03815 [Candidatus Pacearchaeota archaeon]
MENDSSRIITLYSEIISPFNPRPLRKSKLLDIIGNKNYVCQSEETKLFSRANNVFQGMIKDRNIGRLADKLIDAYHSIGYKKPNFKLKNYESHEPIREDQIVDLTNKVYVVTKGVSDMEASKFIDALSSKGPNVEWENAYESFSKKSLIE